MINFDHSDKNFLLHYNIANFNGAKYTKQSVKLKKKQ